MDNNPTTEQSQTPARACPKDCRKCGWQQQTFCAAQLSFDLVGIMNSLFAKMDDMEAKVKELRDEVSLMGGTDELISPSSPRCPSSPFNPNKDD